MAAPRKYSLELRERAVRMYRTSDPKPQIKNSPSTSASTPRLCVAGFGGRGGCRSVMTG